MPGPSAAVPQATAPADRPSGSGPDAPDSYALRPPATPDRAESLPGTAARHPSAPAAASAAEDTSEPGPAAVTTPGGDDRSAATARLPRIPAEPAASAPTATGPAGTVPSTPGPSPAAAQPSRPAPSAPASSAPAGNGPHTTAPEGHMTESAPGTPDSYALEPPAASAPGTDERAGVDARGSSAPAPRPPSVPTAQDSTGGGEPAEGRLSHPHAPAPGEQVTAVQSPSVQPPFVPGPSVPGAPGAGPQQTGDGARPPAAPAVVEAAAGQQPGGGAPHPQQPAPGAPVAPHPYAPMPAPAPVGYGYPAGAALAPAGYGPGAPAGPAGPWQYDPWAGGAAGSRPPEGKAAGKPVSRSRLVTGALVVALVAGGLGGGIGAWLERDGGPGHRVTLPQAPADKADRDPGSIAGIAARALPGVVTLHVRGSGGQGTGTGFVLDNKGHILTNNHVVEPAGSGGEIQVTFNGGQTAKATVIGRDSGYDLAVVKVKGVSGLTPLPLGNSDSVHVGDSVVAIGAPFDLAGTVTTGIISAKARPITAGGKKGDGSDVSYVDALQTDAPINPGNSGGPLVDSRGRVIGINSAIRSAGGSSESGGQGGSIGLGFAIPINQAKRVAEELINTGRATHPVIGVSLDMEYQGEGARVNPKGGSGTPVTPGGPAEKAGIAPGDVIKKVDDVPVRSGQELIVKIRSHRPGDRLTLTVERDGKERTVRMTLGTASSS
ncbi:trypsin-like peptidase domain-containing protein [Streptomyces sp. TYQ1024]|nr:trypsin-like peptidase domain-containing protein [Streptomyces sp. TYQ1024]